MVVAKVIYRFCLCIYLSPMHSAKLNWTLLNSTELNCSVQFIFPLCIEPSTTCDDSATKLAVVAGSSQSGHTCESANECSVCRWTKTDDELRRLTTAVAGSWLSRTCDGRRSSSRVQCTAKNWIKLNWTERSSSVHMVACRGHLLLITVCCH